MERIMELRIPINNPGSNGDITKAQLKALTTLNEAMLDRDGDVVLDGYTYPGVIVLWETVFNHTKKRSELFIKVRLEK